MQKRDVIRLVLEGKRPPYVPWSMGFTKEAKEKLQRHYGCDDLEGPLQNHLLKLGSDIGFFSDLGNNRVRDVFGVVWDRSIDQDIGNVEGQVLPEPTLAGYEFPDPLDPRFFADIASEDRRLPRPLPRVPDRVFALRAGVDAAGHGTVDDRFLRPPRVRPRVAGPHRRLQHRPGPRGPEIRHRRRLFRRRLGPAARLADGAPPLAGVHPAATRADVRRGPRGGQVRDDPLLRRR